jgi:hypothetical protein
MWRKRVHNQALAKVTILSIGVDMGPRGPIVMGVDFERLWGLGFGCG